MKGSCTSLRKRVGDVFSHEAKARNLSQEAFADHDVLRRAQNGFVEEGGGGFRLSTLARETPPDNAASNRSSCSCPGQPAGLDTAWPRAHQGIGTYAE